MRRAHWGWPDPLESSLLPAVSAESLMAHARAIASWERESGSPGEARAFDYIESCLKGYGLEVERREIEAFISLPLESRVLLPDGTALPALTHSFSTSTGPGGPRGRAGGRRRRRGGDPGARRRAGEAGPGGQLRHPGEGVGGAGGGHASARSSPTWTICTT